jgi:hypothetical protein
LGDDVVEIPRANEGNRPEYERFQREQMALLSKILNLSVVEINVIRACALRPRRMSVLIRDYAAELVEAVNRCLASGYLRVVSEEWRDEWRDVLRTNGILGPMAGLPPRGAIDVNGAGVGVVRMIESGMAELERGYWDALEPLRPRFARSVLRRERVIVAWEPLALEISTGVDQWARRRGASHGWLRSMSPIGPWRNRWWERYDTGFRLELDLVVDNEADNDESLEDMNVGPRLERADACKEGWPDVDVIANVVGSHDLSLSEWVSLLVVANQVCAEHALPEETNKFTQELWSVSIDVAELNGAVSACLAKGILWRIDATAIMRIGEIVERDKALGPLIPIPRAEEGLVDISPEGAGLFLEIIGELEKAVGFDGIWSYRSIARPTKLTGGYVEAIYEDLQDVYWMSLRDTERYIEYCAKIGGMRVRNVAPLGPWCAYWWDPLPFGYRVEIVSEDCSGPDGF